MRKINQIIIHCSASSFDKHDDISVIREWHLQRGWIDVGYHYFIKGNGTTQIGRPIKMVGAHCRGYNQNSVGICLHGKTIFNKIQTDELDRLVKNLMAIFDIKIENVKGHYEYNKTKTCPNINMDMYRELL